MAKYALSRKLFLISLAAAPAIFCSRLRIADKASGNGKPATALRFSHDNVQLDKIALQQDRWHKFLLFNKLAAESRTDWQIKDLLAADEAAPQDRARAFYRSLMTATAKTFMRPANEAAV